LLGNPIRWVKLPTLHPRSLGTSAEVVSRRCRVSWQHIATLPEERATVNNDPLTAARSLSPTILRLRHETESRRRLPEPIVEGLRETRLCRLAVAEGLQGLATPTPAALAAYEALAYAEPSVSWIVWNNALPCLLGRYLDPAARGEIFRDPQWLYACSTRPTGRAVVDRAGYRVEGRWSLVSGCELAEWILLLCVVEENGAPRMVQPNVPETRFLFVRRGDYEILDTWHVGGLRGTGSHDVVVKGRHVPRARTLSPGDPSTLEGPLGRTPIICVMDAGYGAQALGVGQRAVDTLVEITKTKVAADSGQALRDQPAVLEAITRHNAALDAARSYLRSRVDELWQIARSSAPSLDAIAAVWAAGHHAADAGKAAVEAMYAAGGTSSLYNDCPLERAHRDMHAMLRHIVVQPFWLADAGRVKLGVTPTHPLFAL
jgi:alkylation response protein AidB-like acyl-CoA dehydrogenase